MNQLERNVMKRTCVRLSFQYQERLSGNRCRLKALWRNKSMKNYKLRKVFSIPLIADAPSPGKRISRWKTTKEAFKSPNRWETFASTKKIFWFKKQIQKENLASFPCERSKSLRGGKAFCSLGRNVQVVLRSTWCFSLLPHPRGQWISQIRFYAPK